MGNLGSHPQKLALAGLRSLEPRAMPSEQESLCPLLPPPSALGTCTGT